MPLIQWNDNLSVNVIEIDKQHQKLVGMINDLSDAMQQGKGKDVLGKIIKGLIDYAVSHFKTEEKYFDLYKYPDAIKHKKEHSEFAQKVVAFKTDFEAGKVALSIKVMYFLSDWLKNHIKVVDKEYGPYFNEKGLK